MKFNCNARLPNSVPGPCYGYVHIGTTGATGFPATVLDTAFDGDNSTIVIVAVVNDGIFCDGFEGGAGSCGPAGSRGPG